MTHAHHDTQGAENVPYETANSKAKLVMACILGCGLIVGVALYLTLEGFDGNSDIIRTTSGNVHQGSLDDKSEMR